MNLEKVKNFFSRRTWKLKQLRELSNHVPLRFLICQFIVAHGNNVAENDLKKWLTNDLGFDSHSVYMALRRMQGKELGNSDEKVLTEKNGNLSLKTPFPRFTLIKESIIESWKIIVVPFAILATLFTCIIPDITWGRIFMAVLLSCIILWIVDDFVLRRIKWK